VPKGVLIVESRPSSPEQAPAFHRWYDETHLPEMTALEGVVSARRFAPSDDNGPFVAIYELDAEDIDAVRARVTEAGKTGKLSPPAGFELDGGLNIRFLSQIS
jgi:hypothetical protein